MDSSAVDSGAAPSRLRAWLAPACLGVLVATLAAAVHGIQASQMFGQALWSNPRWSASVGLGLALLLLFLRLASRRAVPAFSLVFAVAIVVYSAGIAGIAAVAALLLVLTSAHALGHLVLRDSAEPGLGILLAAIVKVALGLGVIALAVFALAFTRINTPPVYLVGLLLPLLPDARGHFHALRRIFSEWRADAGADSPPWIRAAGFLVLLALAVRLLAVLHPEVGTDALTTHLALAHRLKEFGGFHFDVRRVIWAVMPMASDWVGAAVYMLSNEAGMRLASFSADLLLVAGVWLGASRLGSRAAGAIAATVYATCPLLFLESSTLFIENLWTLWLCTGLALGLLTVRSGDRRLLVGAAVLLGTGLCAKVIGVLFVLSFFLVIVGAWFYYDRRSAWGKLASAVSVVAMVAVWPYLNAWLRTGNPVFPFMNQIFRSPYFETKEFSNSLFLSGTQWSLLYDLSFQSGRYLEARPGAFGLLYFLLGFAGIVASVGARPLVRWGMACSLLFVVLVFHEQSYLRYIMPTLPVFAVAIGVALAGLLDGSRALRSLLLPVLLVGGVAGLYLTPASCWYYTELRLPPVAGSDAWREFRYHGAPETYASDVLNGVDAKRVLWTADPRYAGTDADVFVANWTGFQVATQLGALHDVAEFNRWIGLNSIDHLVTGPARNAPTIPFLDAFLAQGADLVASRGDMKVWRVRESVLFNRELLGNPGFDAGAAPWSGDGLVDASAGTVSVAVNHPFVQQVPVAAGRRYLLEVQERCAAEKASFRLQVNWLTAAGKALAPEIEVHDCDAEFSSHVLTVTAPADAAAAIIYASGHEADKPVEFTLVSFRS